MILVTNDDGIFAPGLWALARALQSVDDVVIVAPDREQSAIGTAMTLRQPLRVRRANSIISGVEAFAVDGTPGDSVLLAVGKLFEGRISLVVSGINEGFNLGDDVLISGTVGAALQGYLRNLPALAVSVLGTDEDNLNTAARLSAVIAERIKANELPADVFLNINVPDRPLGSIKGIVATSPAHKSHLDSVEEGSDGRRNYYWLGRRKVADNTPENTDSWAIGHGLISITPLHTALFNRPAPDMGASFCDSLLSQLKKA
jgi:5'-nucleotidase